MIGDIFKEPDGYDGYEGGAPYWIGPNDKKHYNFYEWFKEEKILGG